LVIAWAGDAIMTANAAPTNATSSRLTSGPPALLAPAPLPE
jgi:hypothetical protein